MATIDDVQQLLRSLGNVALGDKVDGSFPVTLQSTEFQLPEVDIDDYLNIRASLTLNPETAMFMPGYYEHSVDMLGVGPSSYRLWRRNEDYIQLASQDGQLSVELSRLSARFTLAILDKLDRRQILLLRRRMPSTRYIADRYRVSGEQPHLRDIFGSILSIKVSATTEHRARLKQSLLESIAEAALFNISYARGIGLSLSRSWERSYYRLGVQRDYDIQLPRRTYSSDLIAYYHLALSSDSVILAYLSLYKVLEYFYLSTAETVLHKRLRDKLAAPNFTYRQTSQLRELASLVRRFDQKTDEQRMLTGVIEHYFMVDEIVGWVREYESSAGQYYTATQTVLGLQVIVDLNTDQLAPSLAKRIYHIRNALVHNKEGDLPRFIPFTGQEDVLVRELPILLFLAEQLIVKTGEDI
jgi:hypothetical protein